MKISLIAHNIRSTHNVGAFFRTCDCLGIDEIIVSGYTPYPKFEGDDRLPHFADKITRQIHKTALGAESSVSFHQFDKIESLIKYLNDNNFVVVSLEQNSRSLSPEKCIKELSSKYKDRNIALLVGNEIHGVDSKLIDISNLIMEIPMSGSKESLNVSIATGIALYLLSSVK